MKRALLALRSRRTVAMLLVGATIVLGVAITVSLNLAKTGHQSAFTIATATPGGTYYPLGRQLARILEGLPDKLIDSAIAQVTPGSRANVQLLIESKADIAFMHEPALVEAVRDNEEAQQRLGVLARLYRDVVVIAVRKDAGIEAVVDLHGRKIFIGPEGSGTRLVATRILEAMGVAKQDYTTDDAASFDEGARRLVDGEVDGAFFMLGIFARAVTTSLQSGEVKLLSLDDRSRTQLTTNRENALVEERIPANLLGANQPQEIQTVGANVFLVARRGLVDKLAFVTLRALFDNLADLLLVDPRAEDIRLLNAFDSIPEGLSLHPGAQRFQERESEKLLIATGAVRGRYYELGRMIQLLLNQRGIPTRVVQTGGSLENMELLAGSQPALAIIQYDAALAALFEARSVYKLDFSDEVRITPVKNLRRIAVLHTEKVHVVARREHLRYIEERLARKRQARVQEPISTLARLAVALQELSPNIDKLRVCIGPRGSATQVVARAILGLHGIDSTLSIPSLLSVRDMVDRLHGGEIDVGFFVSHVPSGVIKTVLNDGNIRLLSLGHAERASMTSSVFSASEIPAGTYASQRAGESAIQTVATRAVLVTTDDLARDVEKITEAILSSAAYLGVPGGMDSMAQNLTSLPLHAEAKGYYQKAGLLPRDPHIDWLKALYYTLVILAILIAGCEGLLKLRRDRTFNEIGRRALAIPVEAGFLDAVRRLRDVRDEVQSRVRKRWWQSGELDKRRWRYLHDLADGRMTEARDNLARGFVADIGAVATDGTPSDSTVLERYRSIERRAWECFANGDLSASQESMLRELLHRCRQEVQGDEE